LLVVISIVAVLLAVLLSTLARARAQARAVACQANLRQWGTLYATALAENNGQWATGKPQWAPGVESIVLSWGPWGGWSVGEPGTWEYQMYEQIRGILCCPTATRRASDSPVSSDASAMAVGGTFRAWTVNGCAYSPGYHRGSYGANWSIHEFALAPNDPTGLGWNPAGVRNGSQIPVYLDSCVPVSIMLWDRPPPPRDAIPTLVTPDNGHSCINRHNGYVNGLFWDASVRRIGLKELWTLKWNRDFKTSGRWTIAGGAQPEDWPQWMRGFKDY